MNTLARRSASLLTALTLSTGLAFGAADFASAAPAPVSNLHSTSCPNWIQQGQTSGCVTRLQNLLNSKQGAGLVADGIFGSATASAVKKWQSNHGLVADGIVGSATKNSIDPVATTSRNAQIVNVVNQLMAGTRYRYAMGGGHAATPGPSTGSYNAAGTSRGIGLDCSGFSRWVYAKAFGYDKLGSGTAANQSTKGVRTSNPQPGDLVFYTQYGNTHHVAVYMGGGKIAHASNYGAVLNWSTVAGSKYSTDVITYEHFTG